MRNKYVIAIQYEQQTYLKQAHADDIKRLRDRIQELEHLLELSKASERELKSLMNVPDEINGFLFRKTSKNRMVKRYCILR